MANLAVPTAQLIRATYLSVKEAAAELAVHPNTIYELLKAGRLPATRVGGAWRIPRASLWAPSRREGQMVQVSLSDIHERLGRVEAGIERIESTLAAGLPHS